MSWPKVSDLAAARDLTVPHAAQNKKAPATLERMTDAFVRELIVVGPVGASLPSRDLVTMYHASSETVKRHDGVGSCLSAAVRT